MAFAAGIGPPVRFCVVGFTLVVAGSGGDAGREGRVSRSLSAVRYSVIYLESSSGGWFAGNAGSWSVGG